MRLTERRLLRVTDQIAAIDRDLAQAIDELTVHRHLHDDAVRDAAVSGDPIDRADVRETEADIAALERNVEDLRRRRAKLEEKRRRLLDKLS